MEKNTKLKWSKWIPILDCMKVGHLTNPMRNNNTWYTTIDGISGGVQGPILLDGNQNLFHGDIGIYHLKISVPGNKMIWYIGKSSSTGDHSIHFRISKHIIALLNLPDRSEYISSLRSKFPHISDSERQSIFQQQRFETYEEFRKYLSSASGESYYRTKPKFYDVFCKYPMLLEHESINEFLEKYVVVRFYKMPGKSSIKIKKAEAAAISIQKFLHSRNSISLNTIDESCGISDGFQDLQDCQNKTISIK